MLSKFFIIGGILIGGGPGPLGPPPGYAYERADVNEDSCDRPRRAQSLRYSQIIIVAS